MKYIFQKDHIFPAKVPMGKKMKKNVFTSDVLKPRFVVIAKPCRD
jgi:hypothetical protein